MSRKSMPAVDETQDTLFTSEALSTSLIHHAYRPPAGFDAIPVGVYKASTVLFRDVAALRAHSWQEKHSYSYGLHGTPTTFTLEARLASLEGGTHALLAPSGLAAITLVNQCLLSSGDALLLPDNVYGPNKNLALNELARWGIAHRFYDPMRPQTLTAALDADVALVWLEAAGSVTLEFPDLRTLVRDVRAAAPRATIALDNTWGAGLAFNAFELHDRLKPAPMRGAAEGGAGVPGVDLTIHALTKFPSGGADVLMGAVVMRSQSLYDKLSGTHSRLGFGVSGSDVELVLRGLPTLALRYAAQDTAARHIANWAAQRSEFVRVLNPATPGSPGHEHWRSHCGAAAGLLTLEFQPLYTSVQVDRFVDALRRFGIGWSWGGPMSLAVPYQPPLIRGSESAYRGVLVRLCVGLEAVEDLIADLERALASLAPA